MLPERRERIRLTALRRQLDWTVVLEDVQDPHNLSAVLRTCESVGICEVHVVYSEGVEIPEPFTLGQRSSQGTRKWVDVVIHRDLEEGLGLIRSRYGRLIATHLGKRAEDMYTVDFSERCALLLGNEKKGLSERAIELSDVEIVIPQMGMAQSLNISVACAVTLYEGLRQRQAAGRYSLHADSAHSELEREYIRRHQEGHSGVDPEYL